MWVPLTPLDFYRRSRRLYGDKAGVVDGEARLTFAAFADRAERLAGALRAAGLRPRDIVSVVAPNTHPLLEAFYGVPLAGGVVHPVNPRLAPLEIAELLNDAGARILLLHADVAPVVAEILGNLKAVDQLVVFGGGARGLGFPVVDYEGLLARAAPHAPDLSGLDEDAPLALFHTSGGAARPKGVFLSHRALALHALYAAIAMGLREEDVSLCTVPFAYMNGGGNPQVNLAVAATSVLAARTDPEAVVTLLEREGVTVWITAPTALKRLLRYPAFDRLRRSRLRLVLVGGAPVAESTIAETERRLGGRCLQVYGLTETSPFVTAAMARRDLPPGESREGQAIAGLPILGVDVRVVDEAGREVPRDGRTPGEILVRGNNVMTAYHRDPEATQDALRGGWLHTGDLATVDGDGHLRVRGRKSDVILVDGRRVRALEIESALLAHRDVRDCSVIAAPDVERGEVPVALVVLHEGSRTTERALAEFLQERLAPGKRPHRIEFLPKLPRNEAGEVLKSELKTVYARG